MNDQPINLKPYTVTETRSERSYGDIWTNVISSDGRPIHRFDAPGMGEGAFWVSLLNQAYQAGIKRAMVDASVFITDLGDLAASGDTPDSTARRLAKARTFYEGYWEVEAPKS